MKLIQVVPICLLAVFAFNGITSGIANEISTQTDINDGLTKLEKLVKIGKKTINVVKNFNKIAQVYSLTGEVLSALQGETTSINTILKEQHNEVMSKLNDVSAQINDVSSRVSDGFRGAIRDITTEIENIHSFLTLSNEISAFMETVDIQYRKSLGLRIFANATGQSLNQATLEDFERSVFNGNSGMADTLEQIHSRIYKHASRLLGVNFLEAYKAYSESSTLYPVRCNKRISPNQRLYYIYLAILANELKGLAVLSHGYEIRSMLRPALYDGELSYVYDQFNTRLEDYKTAIKQVLPEISTDIRRCNPNLNTDGEAIQLEELIRFHWGNQRIIDTACENKCSDLRSTQYFIIENPMDMKDPLTICPNNDYSIRPLGRAYEWMKNSEGKTFGPERYCINGTQTVQGKSLIFPNNRGMLFPGLGVSRYCGTCGWTRVHMFGGVTEDQVTDIGNNMILTGVRFREAWFPNGNSGLAIQIQEGKLLPGGQVIKNEEFKEISVNRDSDVNRFDTHYRRIYIDDVLVDEYYAVTGIRMQKTNARDGFKIQVRATKYDFNTGKLNTYDSYWHDPEDGRRHNAPGYGGYRQDIEINGKQNNPGTPGAVFTPDRGTNSKIKFVNTNVETDVGQITIPLFDAQSVSGHPAIPLRGIGLFYKKSDCCGGFVAPRLFTDSFHNYLK